MSAKLIHKIELWAKLLVAAFRSNSNQQFYDRISGNYDEIFVEHKRHAIKIAQLLVREFAGQESGTQILDVGCGTGLLSNILSTRGFNVVGIDFSQKSLALLHQRYPDIAVLNADVVNLPIRINCCQAVVSLGAWRHFIDTQKAMDELVKTLTKNGVLIIGYFPPSYAGAIHQGQGYWAKLSGQFYQWVLRKLGYVDNVSPDLESHAIYLAKRYFESVVSVKSGPHWRLIMARNLRKYPHRD
jgi:ubiquinone/menaquinone biosynthesis C-methylase UbiE